VFLSCAVPELQRRLREQGGGDRPSLTGADPVSEVATVLEARLPTYRELADVEIDVTRHSPETAASRVCEAARKTHAG
jgi:shikimate kinase